MALIAAIVAFRDAKSLSNSLPLARLIRYVSFLPILHQITSASESSRSSRFTSPVKYSHYLKIYFQICGRACLSKLHARCYVATWKAGDEDKFFFTNGHK
jgi:hypothetical protein